MGLDIYVHKLIKPTKELKNKVPTEKELHEKYPAASVIQFDEIVRPPDFPEEYLFKARFEFISFEKLLEKYSTPERPLNWDDGWRCGGGGTSPWGGEDEEKIKEKYQDCTWFYCFYRPDVEDKEIWLPGTDKYVEGCLVVEEHPCFMHDGSELGYMRKGANCQFYSDMRTDKTKSNWVFSKEILDQYAEMYFDTENDERYGNARQVFKEQIQKPFGTGKGKLVWFWY